MSGKDKLLIILGPTATGKTNLAVSIAHKIGGEIISADSRQVYRGMTIGTGKDLNEYNCCGEKIPYHLIDIRNPGYEYNVYEFQKDFITTYKDIISRGKKPILCGGTGMYIDSIVKKYPLYNVPDNMELRKILETKTDIELIQMLRKYKDLHNHSDSIDRKRTIRAIEIANYYSKNKLSTEFPEFESIVFGISLERKVRRDRISNRLRVRLREGMIEEVEKLLRIYSPDEIMFYGLEYKYLTQYIIGRISKEEMTKKLETAIHQFAKRQMTWFRRMERQGTKINWIDGTLSTKRMSAKIESVYKKT